MAPPAVELASNSEPYIPNSKDTITKIFNARVLKNHTILEDDYIWIRGGKICDPTEIFWSEKVVPDVLIDAKNALLVPGYIDLQINGAFGVDFTGDCDDIEEGLRKVSIELIKKGVTSYCPTIVSSRSEVYSKVLSHTKPRKGSRESGSEILGAHLEGPFLSDQKYGAHEVATLRTAANGISEFNEVYSLDKVDLSAIAIITVAPDLEGMMDVIPELSKKVPLLAIGHSPATVDMAEQSIKRGARMVTHMFNAMQQFHHRDPGIIGVLGSSISNRPFYGIISDGQHVHPNSIKIAYYSHPKGICLVTDAMSAMGLPDGTYNLGKMDVEVSKSSVYIAGTKIIAGSIVQLDQCVRNFKKYTGCTVVEAIEAATLHPAQALGISHMKGSLNHGCDADILFLDDDLNVQRVFVNGEEAAM